MDNPFRTKYRISRDHIIPTFWEVQYKYWWWPFWIGHGNGLLNSPEQAFDLIQRLKRVY